MCFLSVLVTCSVFTCVSLWYGTGLAVEVTPHEFSPGVHSEPYDYFHPVKAGSFRIIVTPTHVWDQITPASVAGIHHAGLLPVLPGQRAPDLYGAEIVRDIAQRRFLEITVVGDPASLSSDLIGWFETHGASHVETIQDEALFVRSVKLADQAVPSPRCLVVTTFNLLSAHLAAVGGGIALALRDAPSLPATYRQYLERHKTTIERIYLVDVARTITESQAEYHSYGNLTVPDSVEEEVKAWGIPVQRITGTWEEDVSVDLALEMESLYRQAVARGDYEHLPMGWIPSSSLKSEWTNVGALIPFAVAKQWLVIEYWADIHMQGRMDTVAAFSDRYVEDFFLGLACLTPDGKDGAYESHTVCALSRREQVLCTIYRWLAGYLHRTHIRDFILCEANGPYGDNAAPIFNFEQVPGMVLCSRMPDLYYRGWSGGGGLSGIDYDGSMAARKSCAVILLALERALYPPLPWDGEIEPAWPPREVQRWEEAPRAVCPTSDYEGWYANVFVTPKLIDIARRKRIKFTLRPQGDISFSIPDYLRRYYVQGQGVIEFSNQGFLHEFNLLPFFSPYDHEQFLHDAVDRMRRYAGIHMVGFMPAGGFLTSADLLAPARARGLHYVFCPQGKYVPILDKIFDTISYLQAPRRNIAPVSHFSERLGDLAYYPTVEEDIQDTIGFVEKMMQQYDHAPYAPYTAWHFAHGFQMPDEASFQILESVVDYLNEQYVEKGELVFATLADIASYFETGSSMIRTPAVTEPLPSYREDAADDGCGSCTHLPPGTSRSPGANFLGEGFFLVFLVCCFFTAIRRRGTHLRHGAESLR